MVALLGGILFLRFRMSITLLVAVQSMFMVAFAPPSAALLLMFPLRPAFVNTSPILGFRVPAISGCSVPVNLSVTVLSVFMVASAPPSALLILLIPMRPIFMRRSPVLGI